ncbi:TIR domain-containing protein [Streptomyces sp. TLI_55]|uniref:TIR domain-containing protein n=1 Tax=Streptomyces sp. TLI_55 TaxID=1938861 RepID=UPI000BCB63D2|nr:TIR domain-containing protein [Streptomyces sp. TLI_55]SNX55747.1 TIR domain-containing protein [Streptomyces sp. TLI_55]
MNDLPNDVFLSYAADDADWAERLAGELVRHGLTPFFAPWSIEPADVIVHRLDGALLGTRNGIAVISPASARSPRAMDEYAALATASAERGLRFIPVLLGRVAVPPFAANRVWRDFSEVSDEEFAEKAAELAAVIAGRPGQAGPAGARDNLTAAQRSPSRPLTAPDVPAFVVCYADADAEYGRALAGQLRTARLPVWSVDDLRPGDAQFWAIRRQLREALAVVVVMTPRSQDSDDVTRMILEGQVHGRPFVPVLLDGEANYHLATVWHIDARDGALLDDSALDLLRRLREDIAGARTPRLPEPARRGHVPAARLTSSAGLEELRDHLAEGEYEHADLLTTRLVMEAAGRTTQGWLSARDAATVPRGLLAGIDALWAGRTDGRQGFRRQLSLAPVGGRRGPRFPDLSAALGWRDSAESAVPRLYRDFAQRAGPGRRSGFYPTLRDPGHENDPDWYDRWSSTVLALHARLREWGYGP